MCHCSECDADRRNRCQNLHRYVTEVHMRLQKLTTKFNPYHNPAPDNLMLTRRRKLGNLRAKQNNGQITFDPSITSKTNLAECFQVFTRNSQIITTPAEHQPPANGITLHHQNITVYIDGSCIDNGETNARCGVGIWFGKDDPKNKNKYFQVDGPHMSNQIDKLATITRALEVTPNHTPLTINTDCKYMIEGLTIHLQKWEDMGWIGISNKKWFQRATYLLRR
jgi:ribonuclease HI